MSVDVAYERLRKANPVAEPSALRTRQTDVGVFLAATRQRSTRMDTNDIEKAQDRGKSQPKPGWRTAVVAFLAVVAFGSGLVVLAQRDGDASSGFEERVEIVEAQAQAYSEGDIDLWLSYFTPSAAMWNTTLERADAVTAAEAFVAAEDQWRLVGACEEGDDRLLICPMSLRDDFHGAGGLSVAGDVEFRFDTANKVARVTHRRSSLFLEYRVFALSFDLWLEAEYPAVHAGFGSNVFDTMPNANDMLTALDYVDEFVAQSDVYPISP